MRLRAGRPRIVSARNDQGVGKDAVVALVGKVLAQDRLVDLHAVRYIKECPAREERRVQGREAVAAGVQQREETRLDQLGITSSRGFAVPFWSTAPPGPGWTSERASAQSLSLPSPP